MSDRERREKVIASIERAISYYAEDGIVRFSVEAVKILLEMLKEQPEIVRCKDCVRHGLLSCPKMPYRPDDWFCADGERR